MPGRAARKGPWLRDARTSGTEGTLAEGCRDERHGSSASDSEVGTNMMDRNNKNNNSNNNRQTNKKREKEILLHSSLLPILSKIPDCAGRQHHCLNINGTEDKKKPIQVGFYVCLLLLHFFLKSSLSTLRFQLPN